MQDFQCYTLIDVICDLIGKPCTIEQYRQGVLTQALGVQDGNLGVTRSVPVMMFCLVLSVRLSVRWC